MNASLCEIGVLDDGQKWKTLAPFAGQNLNSLLVNAFVNCLLMMPNCIKTEPRELLSDPG